MHHINVRKVEAAVDVIWQLCVAIQACLDLSFETSCMMENRRAGCLAAFVEAIVMIVEIEGGASLRPLTMLDISPLVPHPVYSDLHLIGPM